MSSENESGRKAVEIICLTRREASGNQNENMKVKPSFPMMNGSANLTAGPPSNVCFRAFQMTRGFLQVLSTGNGISMFQFEP